MHVYGACLIVNLYMYIVVTARECLLCSAVVKDSVLALEC